MTILLKLHLTVVFCIIAENSVDAIHNEARSNNVKALEDNLSSLSDDKLKDILNKIEDGTGQSPLMAATLAGAEKSVAYLLSKGADATIGEKDGYTPFHGAGFQGRAAVAKELLKHKLDPSDRHTDGYTPLHRACWGREQRHTEMVRVLMKAGVDPEEASSE